MKTPTPETSGDTKSLPPKRDSKLSKDGKWKSFRRVPNLLQYVTTGIYFARVKVDGKVIRRSLDTDVFTTARWRLPDFIKKEQRKSKVTNRPETFAEARKLYEQALESEHTLSPNTKRYRLYCLKVIDRTWPDLASTRLTRISKTDCQAWAKKIASELDEQYFNNTLGTFRAIIRGAKIPAEDDPSDGIKRFGVKIEPLQLPDRKQFAEIIRHVETSGARQAKDCAALVQFLAYSGCRISEARQCVWADVDEARGVITIRNAKTRSAKSHKTAREVPIISEMHDLLSRIRPANAVSTDKICRVGECEKSLRRACRLVGVPVITHHSLRHLFATTAIESNVDVPTVAGWLGHRDGGALAMKVYGHRRNDHSALMGQRVSFAPAEKPQNILPMTEAKAVVQ